MMPLTRVNDNGADAAKTWGGEQTVANENETRQETGERAGLTLVSV